MTESEAIAASPELVTVDSLVALLRNCGIQPGDVLLVHSSLSAIGWVCGGPVAVIDALMRAVGATGTVAMPAYSAGLSDPANWRNPPVPPSWHAEICATMPAFDPRRTPTLRMGAIAESFRTWPDVLRSNHPTSSMAAHGPQASFILERHPLDDPLGEQSPLGRLYELDAKVLLLGVGHDKNTSLHLAERKAFGARQPRTRTGAPVIVDWQRQWVAYKEPTAETGDFNALGADFEAVEGNVVRCGAARAMRQRALVDFAVPWLLRHR